MLGYACAVPILSAMSLDYATHLCYCRDGVI